MSKIIFDKETIWDRKRLPTEWEAMKLINKYAPGYGNIDAATALSAGIEVHTKYGIFYVELRRDVVRLEG